MDSLMCGSEPEFDITKPITSELPRSKLTEHL